MVWCADPEGAMASVPVCSERATDGWLARFFLTPHGDVDSVEAGESAVSASFSVVLAGFPHRPRRLAWPRTPPSHGENTSSNLVGDAILRETKRMGVLSYR